MAKYGKKLKAIMELIEKGGTMAVMLARQLPITGGIMNLLLGLTPIKKRDFTFGTLLGTLPEAVPAVVLGNSFSYTNFKTSILSILLSIALLIIVWLFSGFLTLRFKKTETTLNT